MVNKMIDFATNNRTTDYFKAYAIQEIRIAYRIMDYLAPDDIFMPTVDEHTKKLMLEGNFDEAFERIENEIEFVDIGSSSGMDSLRRDAIETMKHLLPVYIQTIADKKETRKAELLKELAELESS